MQVILKQKMSFSFVVVLKIPFTMMNWSCKSRSYYNEFSEIFLLQIVGSHPCLRWEWIGYKFFHLHHFHFSHSSLVSIQSNSLLSLRIPYYHCKFPMITAIVGFVINLSKIWHFHDEVKWEWHFLFCIQVTREMFLKLSFGDENFPLYIHYIFDL